MVGILPAFRPLRAPIDLVGAIISPIMFFAAPLLAFETAYPGVIEEKLTAYLK